MIVPYTELPGDAATDPRPLLDVAIADMDELLFPCLVDSGAIHTLVPRWLADAAGIRLRGAEQRSLSVASSATDAAFVMTQLSAGGRAWEAEIGFCDPWPYSWGLLGQRSFFRYFTVTFRAADFELELTPVAS